MCGFNSVSTSIFQWNYFIDLTCLNVAMSMQKKKSKYKVNNGINV